MDLTLGRFTRIYYNFAIAVYGWLNHSFIGLEQEVRHVIQVGYEKGAQQTRENFAFNVEAVEHPMFEPDVDHAREGFDFVINTEEVEISFSSSAPATVEVTFFLDDVALESSEIVNFELVPLSGMSLPFGEGVFFQRTVEVLIKDSNSEFSQSYYIP